MYGKIWSSTTCQGIAMVILTSNDHIRVVKKVRHDFLLECFQTDARLKDKLGCKLTMMHKASSLFSSFLSSGHTKLLLRIDMPSGNKFG